MEPENTVQGMGRNERELTPPAFALYLVGRVLQIMPGSKVAALWAHEDSYYNNLYPAVDVWDIIRDARRYKGPYPIVAHPPCGPWGLLAWSCKSSGDDGRIAMEMVHRYGGIVEQPHTSKLFRLHGAGGTIETVSQRSYGHRAVKLTDLYIVKV